MNWHLLSSTAVLHELRSDAATGLSSAAAAGLKQECGANELIDRRGKPPLRILWEQFTSTMPLILLGAAFLSAFVGSLKDSFAILAIVFLFAILGFVQEFKAERTMQALKRLSIPSVRVRRDGMVGELPSVDLVPGDIILIETGNLVPADCRIIEAHSLKAQESILTGEADSVEKHGDILTEEAGSLTDQRNMLFMGTTVTCGRGVAAVVETGMATELGRIANMLQNLTRELSPLQKRLDHLGKMLAIIAVAISVVYFGYGAIHGDELRLLLMTAVSLAVAVIPEGLPAVVTITLAIGSQRMLRRHALVRKLPAVESLGSVTVICSDKTGTLTENRMTVTDIVPAPGIPADILMLAAVLCNDAALRDEGADYSVVGEPTEAALLRAGIRAGLNKPELDRLYPRIAEIPFDSKARHMVTLHEVSDEGAGLRRPELGQFKTGDRIAVAKGALDALIPLCSGAHDIMGVQKRAEELALQGKRVLACAGSRSGAEEQLNLHHISPRLTLFGLIAMQDPLRAGARQAVQTCLEAGIRPVMITGDHPMTAVSIAGSLGIPDGGFVTGADLDRSTSERVDEIVGEVSVYARVSPEHKLMIVGALQRRGEVVAMTGDGVNDAPALKKADIGVSMGISGTDVAREAADMVLLDDNFATIVSAVEEGRTIFDNIRKFIEFSVAGNLGKILAVLTLPFFGLQFPLTPLQLLWLNLLTDGLLGMGMGVEAAEPDVMHRAPVSPTARIFDRRMLLHTILTGVVIGTSVIFLTLHHWRNHPGNWQTVLFTSLVCAQIGQALALRSRSHSVFKLDPFSNPLLLVMIGAVLFLQLMVVYLPSMQHIFSTGSMDVSSLIWVLLPAVMVFAVLEIEKLLVRSRPSGIV